uniref:Thioredoxin domain-containing protein n=1 Tax=Globodera rostochiensis TaxID=31243 RepID=A0A914I9H9_GLORO
MCRRLLLLYFYCFACIFCQFFARADDETTDEAEKTNKIEPERPNNEAETDEFKDPSGGFGMDIDWVPWPQAVSVALDLNRPIFLLVHKSWCGACQALKKSFSTSSKRKELLELSNKFVMSNTNDEDETEDEEYAPDGRYIPRLFILGGQIWQTLSGGQQKKLPSNIAYFPQVPDVIRAMKMGLELFEKEQSGEKTEEGESDQKKEKEGGKGGGKE